MNVPQSIHRLCHHHNIMIIVIGDSEKWIRPNCIQYESFTHQHHINTHRSLQSNSNGRVASSVSPMATQCYHHTSSSSSSQSSGNGCICSLSVADGQIHVVKYTPPSVKTYDWSD
jgi:hypothetical protein